MQQPETRGESSGVLSLRRWDGNDRVCRRAPPQAKCPYDQDCAADACSVSRSRRNVRQRTFLLPSRQSMTVVSSIGEEVLWTGSTGRYTAWNVLAILLDDVVLIIKALHAVRVTQQGSGVRAALKRSFIARRCVRPATSDPCHDGLQAQNPLLSSPPRLPTTIGIAPRRWMSCRLSSLAGWCP